MVRRETHTGGSRVAISRGLWLISALCLTLPLWSFWSPPVFPVMLKVMVAALLLTSAVRPLAGVLVLAGVGPMAVPVMTLAGTPLLSGNLFLEALVLAVLAGTAWRWGVGGPPAKGRLTQPSLWFGAAAIASVAMTGARQLVEGSLPAFMGHITHGYFAGPRRFPAWHEAAVWVEALLIALVIERIIRKTPRTGPLLALVAACGLAFESAFSLLRLVQIAARNAEPVRAFWQYAVSTRISPHLEDVNAIGSLFALGTVCWLTIALIRFGAPEGTPYRRQPRRAMTGAIVGTLVMAAALWLTGSRAAQGAALVTCLFIWRYLRRPSLTAMAASLALAGTIGLSLATTDVVQTPRASIGTALNIRVELAIAGIRMAADHPWLGVGLGEYTRYSGSYASPQLIEEFPPAALGENAHNELIQVLGELGLIGLVLFIWYWSRVLGPAVRRLRSKDGEPWLLAWTAGLCAFHLSAMLGHPFLTPYVVYCVFVSVGVVAGLVPEENRTSSQRS